MKQPTLDDVLPEERWTLKKPRTPEEQAAWRDWQVNMWNLYEKPLESYKPEDYTCHTCERANVCVLAYDPYNVPAPDCIWEK